VKTAPLFVLAAATALSVPLPWLHNPRERTAKAIDEWQQRDYRAADRHLEQALELGGENPRALFNAGTGKLGSGAPGAALQPLARAAAGKDAEAKALRPDALYNLGNAYLAAGYAAAAAESYRAALRLRPDHRPTKHNLELALRALEKQPPPQPQQQPQGGGKGGGKSGGGQQPPQQSGGDNGQQPQQPQPQSGANQPGQGQRSAQLPGFNPQRDMSAQQAAFLLEAVENLEREQRRAQAAEQRRQRARTATEKDW
jgi:tetratricopeptide (TPR) repeat protein